MALIIGDSGNNMLTGTAGDDSLVGNAGDDTLNAGLGTDQVDGGTGTDILVVDYSSLSVNVTSYSGVYQTVDYSNLTYYSNIERFNLKGGSGDDTLVGRAGNDTINGGAGNDIITKGTGVDSIDGGAGIDVLVLADLTADTTGRVVTINGSTIATITSGGNTYQGLEVFDNINAGSGNDNISYTITTPSDNSDNIINAGAGDDTLNAGLGTDQVDGGTGTDILVVDYSSLSVNVTSYSGVYQTVDYSNLTYYSNIERFNLKGGSGDDTLVGRAGNDTINGGAGNDIITKGTGVDSIDGGAGIDVLVLADLTADTTGRVVTINGSTIATITSGGNTYQGLEVFDNINAGSGNDNISYTITTPSDNSDNIINAGAGDDTINAGLGTDQVDGGTGTDILVVDYSSLSVNVTGYSGVYQTVDYSNLTYYSNIERFNLKGGSGDDTLVGGTGNDTINGGAGNDIITKGTGVDSIDGGAGIDVLVLADLTADTTGRVVTINGSTIATITSGGNTYQGLEVFDNINAGSGNDNISYTITTPSDNSDNIINAGAGDDTLNAGLGTDQVDGGTGTDILVVDYSSLSVNVTSYSGVYQTVDYSNLTYYSNIERFNLKGGSGDDTLVGRAGNDTINGGAGNDIITKGTGVDSIDGGAGIDVLVLADLTADTTGRVVTINGSTIATITSGGNTYQGLEVFDNINAGSGNDNISYTITTPSDNSDNIINAGAGDDTLNAGLGTDQVDGGTGTDILVVDYSSLSVNVTSYSGVYQTVDYSNLTYYSNIERFNLKGGSGDDTLVGRAGNDTINGGAGNDIITKGTGVDSIDGGAGIDVLVLADLTADTTGRVVTINGSTIATITSGGNTYQGLEVFDNINAGSGNDNISYTITTPSDNSDNIINAGAGDDTINAGLGTDQVDGGTGTDILVVDYSSLSVNVTGYSGVYQTVDYSNLTYYSNIERFNLKGGSGDDTLVGGTGNDTINGGAGNDIITKGTGVDSIDGGAGIDVLVLADLTADTTGRVVTINGSTIATITSGGNTYQGLEVFDNINAGSGNDNISYTITAPSDNSDNIINAGAGDDTINAGLGTDQVDGGTGTDILVVDYSSLSVNVTGYSGLYQTVDYSNRTFYSNIERFNLKGGSGDDTLVGGAGNDTINGGAGNDSLIGGAGDDIITQGAGADTVDGGTGVDTLVDADLSADTIGRVLNINGSAIAVITSGGNFYQGFEFFLNIAGGSGNDNFSFTSSTPANNNINGGAGNDTINGGAGNDTINGGTGNDSLQGGTGNDTYIIDSVSDVISETSTVATEIDTVQTSISYTLGTNLENLILTGTAAINGTGNNLNNIITGNSGNNTLDGGSGNDTLSGGSGNDTIRGGIGDDSLDGGAGNDSLLGGVGNDIYVVDSTGDVVIENLNEGTDTVQSLVSYTLGVNLENLTLTGTGAINGIGNSLNNTITGNSGNNTLNGAAGNDILIGNTGNDIYVVDSTGDVVIENLNEGTDTIQSSVSYTLGVNLENLTLTGTGAINGIGNSLNNTITGNSGNNTLNGAAGNDILIGGTGNDALLGGDGNDTLNGVGSENGTGFQDTLTGGNNNDLYILGNSSAVFYNDGNSANAGLNDYARVTDFNTSQDKIQLKGLASSYFLGSSPIIGISGTAIYLDTNANSALNSTDELVAIVEGVSGLNLTAGYFSYVA